MTHLLSRYLEWWPAASAIAFGGGSPNLTDFGADYYCRLADACKQVKPTLGISVEIVPSRRHDGWERLITEPAVDGVISSIEIWDDAIRSKICTGKAELSKSHYLKRWGQAVERLGPGRVSSVLLMGLEPIESTMNGATQMMEMGVIPTIIPYRPYDASPLGRLKPVSHFDYLSVSTMIARELSTRSLSPNSQPGCTACGACSLEVSLTPRTDSA
jgi:hypothetical protein